MIAVVIVSALTLAAGFLVSFVIVLIGRDRAHRRRLPAYGTAAQPDRGTFLREWAWLAWFSAALIRTRLRRALRGRRDS